MFKKKVTSFKVLLWINNWFFFGLKWQNFFFLWVGGLLLWFVEVFLLISPTSCSTRFFFQLLSLCKQKLLPCHFIHPMSTGRLVTPSVDYFLIVRYAWFCQNELGLVSSEWAVKVHASVRVANSRNVKCISQVI